jgi:hypothetical protein
MHFDVKCSVKCPPIRILANKGKECFYQPDGKFWTSAEEDGWRQKCSEKLFIQVTCVGIGPKAPYGHLLADRSPGVDYRVSDSGPLKPLLLFLRERVVFTPEV